MSLAGYSPWGHKEFDRIEVTEHAHMHDACQMPREKENRKGGEIDHPHFY